jgi:hypothetical protein
MGQGKLGVGPVDDIVKGGLDALGSLLGSVGAGAAVQLVSGNGFFDIPEVWQNSSFTKNYNFNVQLRARYGDPVSIFQSIYVPLALILGGSLPRSIGKNMYTSPFLVRAYCKGMFAIPCGIIESVNIVRGAAEFGWNHQMLPTCVDVTMNIKDLSPAMFLALADSGGPTNIINDLLSVFARESSLQEYLNTLSGMGLIERYRFLKRKSRQIDAMLMIQRTTTFNSLYWSNNWGKSGLAQMVAAISPFDRVSNK